MSRITRWLIALAAAAFLGVYAFPLWRVTLGAPQYPEGIGMLIHVNGVTGAKEHDLENINGLNHYIGMQRIEPDAIPELRFMPWIAGIIAVSGLLVAWRGRRAVAIAWAAGVLATLGAGVYDFWRWEYDYGHNLNPDAAIRIPGLTYQPPLFGSKQILNFVASSYPAAGGWLLIAAGVMIGAVLVWLVLPLRVTARRDAPQRRAVASALALLLLVSAGLSGCATSGPRALIADADECAQCRMMISDTRFGGEVLTQTGRVQTFDALECLAAYVAQAAPGSVASVWVNDFEHPGTWIAAEKAVFVAGATIGSPMGRALLAVDASAPVTELARQYGGRTQAWGDLLAAARGGEVTHAK